MSESGRVGRQRAGLGALLLGKLADSAAAQSIRRLSGHVLAGNDGMCGLLCSDLGGGCLLRLVCGVALPQQQCHADAGEYGTAQGQVPQRIP